jgi:hypothetical protein
MTGVLLINALMWILPPGMVFYPIRVPEATPHDWRLAFEAAREPKRLVDIRGDRNSGFLAGQPGYERRLAAFLGALGPSQPPETSDESARNR